MKIITSNNRICVMSNENTPIEFIESGEIIKVITLDCFSNRLQDGRKTLKDLPWNTINPCTGPIYVNGAKKGDILKISILGITLGNKGIVIKDSEDLSKYGLQEPDKTIQLEIENNAIRICKNIEVPIQPMIGVIGTAPEKEGILTTLPGKHGGNMDSKMIKMGSVVFLPVYHDGALFSVGDLHAAMGDGEAAGCGIEVDGTIEMKVELIPDSTMPTPMIFADDKMITVATAENLDKAAELSVKMMLEYLIIYRGYDSDFAWKILAATGEVRICQFANKLKTARCEIPARYITEIL